MKQICFCVVGVLGIALAAQSDATAACGDGRSAPSVDELSRLLKGGGLEKGEFETSSQFRDRTAQLFHNFQDARYDRAGRVYATYDADREIVSVDYTELDNAIADGGGYTTYYGIVMSSRTLPSWTYDGENAFGVHKDITVTQTDELAVLTDKWPLRISGSARFRLSLAEAKDILPSLALRVVGSPVAPIKFEGWLMGNRTIAFPYDERTFTRALIIRPTCIALVDRRTHKVLYEVWHR